MSSSAGDTIRVAEWTYRLRNSSGGSTNQSDNLVASIDWGDGSGFGTLGVLFDPETGVITASHVYSTPGSFMVFVRIDNGVGSTAISVTSATVPDERFGVIASGGTADEHLNTLGIANFIDYTTSLGSREYGATKTPYINIRPNHVRLSPAAIAAVAAAGPGSTWYLGGEPNVPAQGGITPAQYLPEFEYYATQIKLADPTARIMSPSILNWDIPCIGCGLGATDSGEAWLTEFVDLYRAANDGENPPVDVWAIDTFPLNWTELPHTDWVFVKNQIQGLRDYLNSPPLLRFTDPIWITETGSHWAYPAIQPLAGGGSVLPDGLDWEDDYDWVAMDTYLRSLMTWLRANAEVNRIEKWFFFRTYIDVETQASRDSYGGIYFLDSPAAAAGLNPLGEVLRDFALGGP